MTGVAFIYIQVESSTNLDCTCPFEYHLDKEDRLENVVANDIVCLLIEYMYIHVYVLQ